MKVHCKFSCKDCIWKTLTGCDGKRTCEEFIPTESIEDYYIDEVIEDYRTEFRKEWYRYSEQYE